MKNEWSCYLCPWKYLIKDLEIVIYSSILELLLRWIHKNGMDIYKIVKRNGNGFEVQRDIPSLCFNRKLMQSLSEFENHTLIIMPTFLYYTNDHIYVHSYSQNIRTFI